MEFKFRGFYVGSRTYDYAGRDGKMRKGMDITLLGDEGSIFKFNADPTIIFKESDKNEQHTFVAKLSPDFETNRPKVKIIDLED